MQNLPVQISVKTCEYIFVVIIFIDVPFDWDHDAISSHLEVILTLSNYELLFVVFRVFTDTIFSEFGNLKGRTENSKSFYVMATMPAGLAA